MSAPMSPMHDLPNSGDAGVPRLRHPRPHQSVAERLTGNQRAFRLPVDPNSGMTGDVHAGDHVDVMASYVLQSNQIETYVLAAGALVMDVTPPADAQPGDANAQGSILL